VNDNMKMICKKCRKSFDETEYSQAVAALGVAYETAELCDNCFMIQKLESQMHTAMAEQSHYKNSFTSMGRLNYKFYQLTVQELNHELMNYY